MWCAFVFKLGFQIALAASRLGLGVLAAHLIFFASINNPPTHPTFLFLIVIKKKKSGPYVNRKVLLEHQFLWVQSERPFQIYVPRRLGSPWDSSTWIGNWLASEAPNPGWYWPQCFLFGSSDVFVLRTWRPVVLGSLCWSRAVSNLVIIFKAVDVIKLQMASFMIIIWSAL